MSSGDEAAALKLFAGPCTFVWGATSVENLPPAELPEVAFVGRSNAGKSSLLNALTGQNHLARVSQTPGRTRQINFFRLGDTMMLADLPGYGYAKASRTLAEEWQTLIFAYLGGRPNLRRVLLLIDARRGVMESDRAVMALLDRLAVSYESVLTKTDELDATETAAALRDARAEAGKHAAALTEIATTSARQRASLNALKSQLAALARA